MINFRNDYSDIAHKKILERLIELQDDINIGYGLDKHSVAAANLLSKHVGAYPIYFLAGGTITNKTLIAHVLKPYEAVISANSGHIYVHETGAIESTGHKIIPIQTLDGKITVSMIDDVVQSHTDEHMVKPKLVYISNATETGLTYSRQELEALYAYTQKNDLFLYIDGARIGVALDYQSDITLKDIANLCDFFYIGGTKNGALFGEALVVKDKAIDAYIRYAIKQNGGLLAKGFITAIQFEVLFEDNLFFEIARLSNEASKYLVSKLKALGLLFSPTETNQQFITLDHDVVDKLKETYLFEIWSIDEKTTIRLVTTYQTKKAAIDCFIDDLKTYLNIA